MNLFHTAHLPQLRLRWEKVVCGHPQRRLCPCSEGTQGEGMEPCEAMLGGRVAEQRAEGRRCLQLRLVVPGSSGSQRV